MKQDANAILTLCSYVCTGEGVRPLEPREYSKLAQKLSRAGRSPKDLFSFTEEEYRSVLEIGGEELERIKRLLDRSVSLSFALEEYRNIGINPVTRADAAYPKKLKKKLGSGCPPVFYTAGDTALLERAYIGYVGARTIGPEDLEFTTRTVHKTCALGYGVVSGGARGVDTAAGTEALLRGSFAVEYLADSLMKKLKKSDTVRQIQNGRLLLLSVTKPDAGFQVGTAMLRNRYIYAQAEATVVVRSDLNKGGTWTGASENLQRNWCPTLCWENACPGNRALIEKGAIPIGTDWDGRIPAPQAKPAAQQEYEQTSLFPL